MICGACGKTCRSTETISVTNGKKLERKRCCATCAGDAIKILALASKATRCRCGEPATQCHVCCSKKETNARKEGADVKAIVKKLEAMQMGARSARSKEVSGSPEWCSHDGRAEGLESAIRLLESGRW